MEKTDSDRFSYCRQSPSVSMLTGVMLLFFLFFQLISNDSSALAQTQTDRVLSRMAPEAGHICTLDPTERNAFYYIGADPQIDLLMKQLMPIFEAEYITDPAGLCDPVQWPEQAVEAFEYALSVWSTHLRSEVPIRVRADWKAIETEQGVTLASAGPTRIVQIPGVGVPGTWYSIAQLTAVTGKPLREQLSGVNEDIRIQINCLFRDWYFGTDAAPPEGKIDFVTVVLHELGHGLGFIGSLAEEEEPERASLGAGNPPLPYIFDRFVEDGGQTVITELSSYPNPSEELFQALTGLRGGLFLAGEEVGRVTGSEQKNRAQLYTPGTYNRGSSYSHLDQELFTNTVNALMRPRIDRAFAVHTPGPVFCGLLRDTGWPLGEGCLIYLAPYASLKAEREILNFGVLSAGDQLELPLRIKNEITADESLQIEAALRGTGFRLLSEAGFTVPPGGTVEMNLQFNPDQAGIVESELILIHNAKNLPSPLRIELIGEALREKQLVQLDQSYPNPIVSAGAIPVISYAISEESDVRLDLFTSEGRYVQTLTDDRQPAGRYRIEIDLTGLSSGVYIYRIVVNNTTESKKLLFFR